MNRIVTERALKSPRRTQKTPAKASPSVALGLAFVMALTGASAATIEIPADVLADKIRGGLLGQMLGNLNGLPHEMKFIDEPGAVSGYVPALPKGAWTDDDTDFEWVYLFEMQRRGRVLLRSDEIASLWRDRINKRIWCSNLYARQLMDLGFEPPMTGSALLNPWAGFNISGQFLCESFALIAPAMPQTASRIGLNYTRVAIDGEPAQTTQLFATMISSAFQSSEINTLLDAGAAAIDPDSDVRQVVADVRRWHREAPRDWRVTRQKIKDRYSRHHGAMRDRNGYELNTACTLAALLHGEGDFARTLELAFNLGWDCDNNAATSGTILGVILGYRKMLSQGWEIVDRYRNETRQEMPLDETITSFADRLIDLAERVIEENGGRRIRRQEKLVFEIRAEPPALVAPLSSADQEVLRLKTLFEQNYRSQLNHSNPRTRARAAYVALCLGLDTACRNDSPEVWASAVESLNQFDQIAQVLFHHSPIPAAAPLQENALRAGLHRPARRRDLW